MTQYEDEENDIPGGGTPLPLPEGDAERPALIAYPLSYARRDEQGRLVLDPARLPAPRAAPAAAKEEAAAAGETSAGELSLLLIVGTVALLLDQLTKRLIEARMPLYTESVPLEALYPYFRFTHTANYGAAFGIFQSGGTIFGIVAAIVTVVIIYYNFVLPPQQRLLRLALGLQMGGALGNLVDRLRLGYVTDFLDVDVSTIIDIPYISDWPIFNLADMAIVSGVFLLAFLMLKEGDNLGAPAAAADEAEGEPDDAPGVIIYDEPARATTMVVQPSGSRQNDDPPWDSDGAQPTG